MTFNYRRLPIFETTEARNRSHLSNRTSTPTHSNSQNGEIIEDGIVADSTIIEYAIRFVPVACLESNLGKLPRSPWTQVKLHIPRRDEFPSDLGLAFDFNSLVRPDGSEQNHDASWGQFAIISIGNEKVQLALTDEWTAVTDSKSPKGRSFEIWTEEIPVEESGFYGSTRKRCGSSPS